jgi:histidinol phosphatase-like PHP family hydrolase
MERLFAKAAEVGMGIELNRDDMMFSDEEEDTVLRMFRIAKYQGCKFYLGSDAHTPKWLEGSIPVFEKAVDKLGLEEKDKFIIQ